MRPLSNRNPHVAQLGRLAQQRRVRASQGAFVVDGPVLVGEALDAGLGCTELFVDAARIDPAIERLVERAERAGATAYSVDSAVLRRSTDPIHPQAVAAVVRRPVVDRSVIATALLVLVLVEVQDPGNAGTLIRAATAAGADVVMATDGTVDLFAPKCVRASAGAAFRVPLLDGGSVADVLGELRAHHIETVAAVPDRGEPHDQCDLTGRVAVLVGNEAHGFDAETEQTVDRLIHIPMPGKTESLNVAMAGTVVCFEINRQRRLAVRSTQLDDGNPSTEGSRPS